MRPGVNELKVVRKPDFWEKNEFALRARHVLLPVVKVPPLMGCVKYKAQDIVLPAEIPRLTQGYRTRARGNRCVCCGRLWKPCTHQLISRNSHEIFHATQPRKMNARAYCNFRVMPAKDPIRWSAKSPPGQGDDLYLVAAGNGYGPRQRCPWFVVLRRLGSRRADRHMMIEPRLHSLREGVLLAQPPIALELRL